MTRRPLPDPPPGPPARDAAGAPVPLGSGERGIALAVTFLVLVLISLLGLALVLIASEESRVAENHLRAEQASWGALGLLRCARQWFEDPSIASGFAVPAVTEMNRSARRVDAAGTGTFVLWSSAPPPWNVVYRSATADPFERPFRGSPSLAFAGAIDGPDVSISRQGSGAEVAFLDRLSDLLYPAYPSPTLRLRAESVSVFGPPVDRTVVPLRRLGIATLAATAVLTAPATGGGEREIAVRTARAILAEPPYRESQGPLLAAGSIDASAGLDVRWGLIAAGGSVTFPAPGGPAAMPSAWPRRDGGRLLVPDMDGDGTPDDTDADGTGDCAEWLALTDDTIEDPWFFASAGGALPGGPSPAGTDQIAWPFDPATIPGAAPSIYVPANDASDLLQGASRNPVPPLDAARWEYLKSAARSGLRHHRYYSWDAAAGLWREEGTGLATDPATTTAGRIGYFFFDTADGRPPRDDTGDGTADNLAPPVTFGAGWSSSGVLILGAASVRFDSLAWGGPARVLALPGEPCADLDASGACDAVEPFLSLLAPLDPLAPGATFRRLALAMPGSGISRRDPAGGATAAIAFDGLLVIAGNLSAGGDLAIHGGVVAGGSVVAAPVPATAGVLRILADPGLARGLTPSLSSGAPRTFITSLWRETASPSTALP